MIRARVLTVENPQGSKAPQRVNAGSGDSGRGSGDSRRGSVESGRGSRQAGRGSAQYRRGSGDSGRRCPECMPQVDKFTPANINSFFINPFGCTGVNTAINLQLSGNTRHYPHYMTSVLQSTSQLGGGLAVLVVSTLFDSWRVVWHDWWPKWP